ncbi:class I SAM-dependent methyltransferase [Calycomorphotria hydatis]|uniref:Bifunctional 3-demethylubiquinone-9 3-methyltransferase/ 2-octaprenyl-6-hydroxy phenol methylase n=1 Tax=Calycomorphotria hydatis TaxID=2528027 RepID=A0A517T655_9PLAN|nr:class I SAM-dependent methyltransferase [Calycomorphotria hydatis]QDT63865.1 bifunctional 3-demethylubiquinone-9 3-methyltransferase/ 2-octaprenyl-6-hydroxy phenol methylase [Calycomorphotria hydatis]
MEIISCCRICQSEPLEHIFEFGEVPVADRLIDADDAGPITKYPLTLAFCPECALVQILETLPPEELFDEKYAYHSSFSDALLDHSRQHALRLIQQESLSKQSLVVEIASNDGYLLKNFAERNIPVLGIDPSESPVNVARELGIDTQLGFFREKLAEHWVREGKSADVILANNVLAHVADTRGFVRGIKKLLKPNGLACFEFPYLRDLITHCEFDTIYHQHLCYFSLSSVKRLMADAGLVVHNVERLPIHGGSLRIHVSHHRPVEPAVAQLLEEERQLGMTDASYYQGFADHIRKLCENLRLTILQAVERGERLAAYGAAAKGTTLLGYLNLPDESMAYVVDRNVHKHGRYLPAGRILIEPVERLMCDRPDVVLLLAWNFSHEILQQQAAFREAGGRFLIPIPEPRIV